MNNQRTATLSVAAIARLSATSSNALGVSDLLHIGVSVERLDKKKKKRFFKKTKSKKKKAMRAPSTT